MENLKIQLNQIARLLKQSTTETELDDDRILAYVEERLSDPEKQEVERIILSDEQLSKEIILLRQLVQKKPILAPPEYLHNMIMRKLGLQRKYFMSLVLKKVSEALRIVKGDQYYHPELGKVLVPTRGNKKNIYGFKSKISGYSVSCLVQILDDQMLIHFILVDVCGSKVKNGRFSIFRDNQQISEIITDQSGMTPRKAIQPGNYEISVNYGQNLAEIFKLDIS